MDIQLTLPSFLTSPIVEIVVGQGEDETVLTAHQTLLLESPFLSDFVGKFDASGPVSLPHVEWLGGICKTLTHTPPEPAAHSPARREC